MAKISATRLGKPFGLSYQKVHKILAEHGLYDLTTRQPTSLAFAGSLVEMKTGKSAIFDKGIDYFAWDDQKTKRFFLAPTELELARFKLTQSSALERIEARFADFGQILEIELSTPNAQISEDANCAVVQSYYGDLGCTRGTLLLYRMFTKSEAEDVYKATMKLATELYEAAVKMNRKKYAERAKVNLNVIECVLDWLREKAAN